MACSGSSSGRALLSIDYKSNVWWFNSAPVQYLNNTKIIFVGLSDSVLFKLFLIFICIYMSWCIAERREYSKLFVNCAYTFDYSCKSVL